MIANKGSYLNPNIEKRREIGAIIRETKFISLSHPLRGKRKGGRGGGGIRDLKRGQAT